MLTGGHIPCIDISPLHELFACVDQDDSLMLKYGRIHYIYIVFPPELHHSDVFGLYFLISDDHKYHNYNYFLCESNCDESSLVH